MRKMKNLLQATLIVEKNQCYMRYFNNLANLYNIDYQQLN